jgi:hypothetical protein
MTYIKQVLVLVTLFSCTYVQAQDVKGVVADRATRLGLPDVAVVNLTTRQQTATNYKGEFSIKAKLNQILVFSQAGYAMDTLLIVNTKNIKRYLSYSDNQLKTVEVSGKKADLKTQYADVYREATTVDLKANQPLTIYPSRIFSKEGKAARKLKRRLDVEEVQQKVDSRFNEKAVRAITSLRGKDLDYFMVLYRPSAESLNSMDDDMLKLYLMDSYKEFKALPAEEKKMPNLRN